MRSASRPSSRRTTTLPPRGRSPPRRRARPPAPADARRPPRPPTNWSFRRRERCRWPNVCCILRTGFRRSDSAVRRNLHMQFRTNPWPDDAAVRSSLADDEDDLDEEDLKDDDDKVTDEDDDLEDEDEVEDDDLE